MRPRPGELESKDMAGKPLSWKWKLTIAFVVLSLFGIIFVLTPWGHNWMYNRIITQVTALPEAEKRESAYADSYLTLAWWRGSICQDSKGAMEMCREFCGLAKEKKNETFFKTYKFTGPLVSPDGKTGWGPMHPRAPEAFYHYLEFYEIANSAQFTQEECWNYYRLFYNWMLNSPDHKVHPNFNKYWPKIKIMSEKCHLPAPADINKAAPHAPPVEAEGK
jgi:hypothetical protein